MSSGDTKGRQRARRLYALGQCEYEGCERNAYDRHHIDGDDENNSLENIARLCRRHHMEADGRLEKFIAETGNHAKRPANRCSNCGRAYKPLRQGRCQPCAVYRRRQGIERPYRQDGRRERTMARLDELLDLELRQDALF